MAHATQKVLVGSHIDIDLKLTLLNLANDYHLSLSKTLELLIKRALVDLENSPKGDLVNG